MSTTIYKTLLTKGYFPKELPPAFNTISFAQFATSQPGRDVIKNYKPKDYFTECCEFKVARTGDESRHFKIPHPYHFAKLSQLCSSKFNRLLGLAGASPFSSSSPAYSTSYARAIRPSTLPGNLARDRALARAASTWLIKADVSHFYPSLYTHAVGWAVDPKLRLKQHWKNQKLLGKQIDQTLMDLDKKFSQGIPIGNDLSFLMGELVLAAVDKGLKIDKGHCYRWFDDYEYACNSESEALAFRDQLEARLSDFRLRLNPRKTEIRKLPEPSQDEWQDTLIAISKSDLNREKEMIRYFDTAFRLRAEHPHAPILSFALGVLFKLPHPKHQAGRVAESAVTQALLSEPGSSQKALSLLSYWKMNGFIADMNLLSKSFSELILRSAKNGTHDLAWALAFCIDNGITLSDDASVKLRSVDNDLISVLSLHMQRKRLLTPGFNRRAISQRMKNADLDREHWLLCYESARHGLLSSTKPIVKGNPLFSAMLKASVSFYQVPISSYSYVVAPGCAPEWIIKSWLKEARRKSSSSSRSTLPKPLRRLIKNSILRRDGTQVSPSEFRMFLRMHDLNQKPEPGPDVDIYPTL